MELLSIKRRLVCVWITEQIIAEKSQAFLIINATPTECIPKGYALIIKKAWDFLLISWPLFNIPVNRALGDKLSRSKRMCPNLEYKSTYAYFLIAYLLVYIPIYRTLRV